MSELTPKEVRLKAGKSQEWVAVHGGTSAQLVRLYEIDRSKIGDRKREGLDAVYASLRDSLAVRSGRAA